MFMYPGTAPDFDRSLGLRQDTSSEPRQKLRQKITKSLEKHLALIRHVRNAHIGACGWLDGTVIPQNQWEIVYAPEKGRKSYFSIGYAIGTISSDIANARLKGKNTLKADNITFQIKTILGYYEYLDLKKSKTEAHQPQSQQQLRTKTSLPQLRPLPRPVSPPTESISDFNFDSTASTGLSNILEKKLDLPRAARPNRPSPLVIDHDSITPPTSPSSMVTPRTPVTLKRMTPPTPPISLATSNTLVGTGVSSFGVGLMPLWSDDSTTDSTIHSSKTTKTTLSRLLRFPRSSKNNKSQSKNGSDGASSSASIASHTTGFSLRSSTSKSKEKELSMPRKFSKKSPGGQYIQSLNIPDERKLCFTPDAYQSMLSVLELLLDIYQQIYHGLKNNKITSNVVELNLISTYLHGIDGPLTNLLLSDAVRSIDAFVLKSALRTQEQIMEDIEQKEGRKNTT